MTELNPVYVRDGDAARGSSRDRLTACPTSEEPAQNSVGPL